MTAFLRSNWRKRIETLFGLIGAGLLIYFLIRAEREGQLNLLTFKWKWFILAVLSASASTCMGVINLVLLVAMIAPTFSVAQIVTIQLRSIPARYLPGSFWNVPTKWMGFTGKDIQAGSVSRVLMLELALLYGIGTLMFLLATVWRPWYAKYIDVPISVVVVVAVSAMLLGVVGLELGRRSLNITISKFYVTISKAALVVAVGWGFMVIALGCCVVAVNGLIDFSQIQSVAALMEAVTSGFIGGFLLIVSPGGVGVREGIMVFMLDGIVQGVSIIAIGICLRISIAIADLLLVLGSLLVK